MKCKNKARPATASRKKQPVSKPAWNDNITDLSRYQLSNMELLQRKVSCSSKNRMQAKEDVSKVQQQLKEGKLPAAYKDAIMHKQKKVNLKEEYRQKAKAIVYPVRLQRNESACQDYNEPAEELDEVLVQPMIMSSKMAQIAFTSATEPKVAVDLLMKHKNIEEDESDDEDNEPCEQNTEPKHYLDCDDNIKNLNKLNEEIVARNTEVDDCMATLNSALGINPKVPEIAGRDTMGEVHKALEFEETEEMGNDRADKGSPERGEDEGDLERISKLIAATSKDIEALSINPHACSQKKDEEDLAKKYENSFFHARANKAVANKENTQIVMNCAMPVNGGGIISRKISNKADISLTSATAPRQLVIASEYYKAII